MTNYQPKDDIETQQLTEEEYIFVQHFEKIYAANNSKITTYETGMKVLQIISILAGLLFLIFFTTSSKIPKTLIDSYSSFS